MHDNDKWCWVCRECGKDGPYSSSDKYPRGWRFNLEHGLICKICAKKLNIKTSDIKEDVEDWECL